MQTEPAISVRADPDFTASQSSDAAALQQNAEEPSEDHPPEFKSAARQEHMNEAAAIRRQMQVGSQEHPLFSSHESCLLMSTSRSCLFSPNTILPFGCLTTDLSCQAECNVQDCHSTMNPGVEAESYVHTGSLRLGLSPDKYVSTPLHVCSPGLDMPSRCLALATL